MLYLSHVGMYVNDIDKLRDFYVQCFDMKVICDKAPEKGQIFDDLYKSSDAMIITTKMITPEGQTKSYGDMVELVKVVQGNIMANSNNTREAMIGKLHICFRVDNIVEIRNRIIKYGGGSAKLF